MIHAKINHIDVVVEEGTTILEAAKKYNINIPTLCHYPDLHINSDCRICVVEIDGYRGLKTSCSTPIRDGMMIKTNSPRVLNSRKTVTELILANHDVNCTSCTRNMNCELQQLSKNLGIDTSRFDNVLEYKDIDDQNPSIVRNPNRCIKCGRCVDVCQHVQGMHVLERMGRGHDMDISPAFGLPLNDQSCSFCGQCANVCPVGAIIEKDNTNLVWEKLHDPTKHVMVQIAPAVRVSIGEEIGLESGLISNGKLVAAMKHLGFNHVYDTNFTADLTIMEEGTELISRINNGGTLPLMTSCCPGWINMAEQEFPEILPHISSCKSPQQMFGTLAKSYYATKTNMDPEDIYVVSVMPCTAKKYEATREEFSVDGKHPDVDVVITTRELGKMFRQMGIDVNRLPEVEFDSPFGITTGAAALFGASGGVTEAALRTVYEIVNERPLEDIVFNSVRGMDGLKEAEVNLAGTTVKVAVSHSLSNARKLIEEVIAGKSPYTFIEIMACPGGCIGGGGQPYGTTNEVREHRLASTYIVDGNMIYRKSHQNPDIHKLYEEYLQQPNSHIAHKLLHTDYQYRKKRT
ncbi:NADH-dependent [FeFe] hydrogenase, group A6 [Candidatus Xianfuyuplasma coldseepsis]|uniref:4Fe-4S dicluster domain-containing protein n=1 Tax=Candidatus Xianfuyuplasma coldseepsis TaxID=2782163 RepID=A0A7L7KT77_9MOLU|nr:NADH-dependent [FeFe] hydrogenase, group A6 [Xianfuyuplasma coldseepsis]QMS85492.1 4Fe-4S dicluster domain-containing protein [Xianfuyuplasma coldseepsis]